MSQQSITITLTHQRLIDGFVEAANRMGMTPEEVVLDYVKTRGRIFADTFKIGLITSGEFIKRFTSVEFGNILSAASTSPEINALVSELTSSPNVALDDERLLPGLQILVDNNLLQPSRIPEILDYSHPDFNIDPNYPENPFDGMSFYDPNTGIWWKYLTAQQWITIDFPESPTDQQQWLDTDTNITWVFNASSGGWIEL